MGFKQQSFKKRAIIIGSLFFVLLLMIENVFRFSSSGSFDSIKLIFLNIPNLILYLSVRILAALTYGFILASLTKTKTNE